MLNIKNLYKSYGDKIILNDVSLCIQSKSIVGLAGVSGSGKTTLLRCIQGLDSYDQGSIEASEHKGFMFQDFQVFPHMNVLENLMYAPIMHGSKKNDVEKKAYHLLEQMGIHAFASSYAHKLSGGQRQRVALARSLMMEPDILLCDEPSSGLDMMTALDVAEVLKSVKDMGVTIVVASHDLHFLCALADRIVLLKEGRIADEVGVGDTTSTIERLKVLYRS